MNDPIVTAVLATDAEVRGWFRKLVSANPVTSVVVAVGVGIAIAIVAAIPM